MSPFGIKLTSKHVRSDVRYRGQSEHYSLAASFPAFDSQRTFGKGSRQV
jgi:hypothetical protein